MMNDKLKESANKLIELRDETNKQIEDVYYELNDRSNFEYILKDHALIRYLQRVELIPVSEARYKILTSIQNFMKTVKPKIDYLKNNTFELRLNDVIYVIKNKNIITIKTDV